MISGVAVHSTESLSDLQIKGIVAVQSVLP